MSELICLDPKYSTTRRISTVPRIVRDPHDSLLKSTSFPPTHQQRKGEGGLRQQGYFKTSDNDQDINPLITVITVVFNGAKTLEQAILSVINQSYDNVEYIIIDGGSTDTTLDIIRKYEHAIDYWISEPDRGIYDAWNKAVRYASGDWVCFLGSDDYFWELETLSRLVPFMTTSHLGVKLVYGSFAAVNNHGELLYVTGEGCSNSRSALGDVLSIPRPGLMLCRSWFENYGYFDISYRIVGDYEMLLRGWHKEKAYFVPDLIVAGMIQGGVSSNPRNTIRSLREIRRAQISHGIDFTGRWFAYAYIRLYVRLMSRTVFGERMTYGLLDFGRRLLGKKPYWTKL